MREIKETYTGKKLSDIAYEDDFENVKAILNIYHNEGFILRFWLTQVFKKLSVKMSLKQLEKYRENVKTIELLIDSADETNKLLAIQGIKNFVEELTLLDDKNRKK